jgi:hypothetical protein
MIPMHRPAAPGRHRPIPEVLSATDGLPLSASVRRQPAAATSHRPQCRTAWAPSRGVAHVRSHCAIMAQEPRPSRKQRLPGARHRQRRTPHPGAICLPDARLPPDLSNHATRTADCFEADRAKRFEIHGSACQATLQPGVSPRDRSRIRIAGHHRRSAWLA